jgi:hypothetical protein
MFNGRVSQTLRSGWGFSKGFMGDFFRSIPEGTMRRVGKDIEDCTCYCDSSRFKASHLKRISVFFGKDDTCMDQWKQLGIKDPDNISKDELKRFKEKFFSDVIESRITLSILPGTHLAPVIHSDLYARKLLADLGQDLLP